MDDEDKNCIEACSDEFNEEESVVDEDKSFKERVDFTHVETEETFGLNLKKSKMILTLWEVNKSGYSKLNETFIFESVNTTFQVSDDGKILLLSLTDNLSFMMYDAFTLTRLKKFKLTNYGGQDFKYHEDSSVLLSKDGKYIFIKIDNYINIFDNEGRPFTSYEFQGLDQIYIYSNTEFARIREGNSYSYLVVTDFLAKNEREILLHEYYIDKFEFSRDFTSYIIKGHSNVMHRDLKNIDSEAKEIVSNYRNVYKYAFKDNKVAIIYKIDNFNLLLSVFKDGVTKWTHTLSENLVDIDCMMFMPGDIDSVMLLKRSEYKFHVYFFEESFVIDYCIRHIAEITFQNLLLIYAWGTEEIWVQDLYNNIKIYRFDAQISGIENCRSTKLSSNEKSKLGLVLNYQDYFRFGEFVYKNNHGELNLYKKRTAKTELPASKIKTLYNIKVRNNETKNIEDGVMLHFKDLLIIQSVKSRSIKHEIKKSLNKHNVVTLRNNSYIFFWEDNKGDRLPINKRNLIQMIRCPYDSESDKAVQTVYEAEESLLLVKVTIINGEEYLFIVDEPMHVKFLKIEGDKVTVIKTLYVDYNFANSMDVKKLKQSIYCNGIMYFNNEANI